MTAFEDSDNIWLDTGICIATSRAVRLDMGSNMATFVIRWVQR